MIVRLLIFTLILIGATAGADVRKEMPVDPAWARRATWDDGKAEVSKYDATQVIYGAPRSFEAVLLTVKEPVNTEVMIKSDSGRGQGVVDAIKMNMVLEVPTPNYDYRFLACVQVRRDDPRVLLRETVGGQEWCGNVYKEFNALGAGTFMWRSYFEAEGNGEIEVPIDAEHLTEEQLFLAVRALEFRENLQFDVAVYPTQLTNHVREKTAEAMQFTAEKVEYKLGGKDQLAWKVMGESQGGRKLTFIVAANANRTLLEFTSSDGRSLKLKSTERDDYWRIK